jgi:UDP-N-acetylglucosamine--dolichyl-phosphate N-acetylglucosaminephosphotransferase
VKPDIDFARAESMGAVSAFVYIFIMFCFIPFPYYKYLVTTTSGAGNRDVEETVAPNFLENGRTLHLFPHNKVSPYLLPDIPNI